MGAGFLERWLADLCATPGLTAVREPEAAWRVHVEDALTVLPYLGVRGPLIDVGSGGGSPGLPLAVARPDLDVHLLEATARKARFLERWAAELPNVTVVCARAEQWGRTTGRDAYAVAVARALGEPAVAAELCLPLVAPGGSAILYAGAELGELAAVSRLVGGSGVVETFAVTGAERKQFAILRKAAPTPDRFPRRPGLAAKRPLAGA